jgi:class 3 adenylate cyclase
VPEHVVDDVLERTDEDLRLGGSRGVGTVMFTDIREFTAFTERTQPTASSIFSTSTSAR